jgi:hypothetical protein
MALTYCLLCSFTASALAQEEGEKALELMRLTGAHQLVMQAMSTVLPQQIQLIRTANPNLDERLLGWLQEEMLVEAQASMEELLVTMAAVYVRHFSSAELDEMIAFYRAPLGQKVLQVMPAVMQESAAAGSEWGERIAVRVMDRLMGPSE